MLHLGCSTVAYGQSESAAGLNGSVAPKEMSRSCGRNGMERPRDDVVDGIVPTKTGSVTMEGAESAR